MENYQKVLQEIDKELENLPTGYLSKRRKTYYHTIDRKDIGITKKPLIIRQLCRKKYLLARKDQLMKNISHLSADLSKVDERTSKQLIETFSQAYQEVPISYFYHPSVETWLTAPHEKHPYPPEEQVYITKNGVRVRSKSELLIATQLENYQIPYQYEAELILGNKKEYPDFIIKSPFTGKTVIWEHFGALHLSGYETKMNEKLDAYLTYGYVPNETIIYTFEFQVKKASRIQKIIESSIL